MTEMGRLKAALEREYEGATVNPVKVFNPKNLEATKFYFRGEKMAKVILVENYYLLPSFFRFFYNLLCYII